MTNAKTDFHDASSKSLEEKPPARKEYRSPELTLYGNLAELTRSYDTPGSGDLIYGEAFSTPL
jgi:hypothetical protein